MRKFTFTTKDGQRITVVTIRSSQNSSSCSSPDDFHIMAFLGGVRTENIILSCNCTYVRREYYEADPITIMRKLHPSYSGALWHMKDNGYELGHILFAGWLPNTCVFDEEIIWDGSFDLATLLRGILYTVSSYYESTPHIPDYFVFIGSSEDNPQAIQWDTALFYTGAQRFCDEPDCDWRPEFYYCFTC